MMGLLQFGSEASELPEPHPHNLRKVSSTTWTGGEPKDDADFAALRRMGIRTVVSVDGAKPDVSAAERHGLRYVHIPIGYDEINTHAQLSLAALEGNTPSPFYIHCHHGRHRGPAAAAIACMATGEIDHKKAFLLLEKAGTSPDYHGLWKAVKTYQRPSKETLLPELVSIAEVNSLAAAMAGADRTGDRLELCQTSDWKTPPGHPDIIPEREALILKEAFRESLRNLPDKDRKAMLTDWLKAAEQSAEKLEAALKSGDSKAASKEFRNLQESCKTCHKRFRD